MRMKRMKNPKVTQMVKMRMKIDRRVKNGIESPKTPFRTSLGWAIYLTRSRDRLRVPVK